MVSAPAAISAAVRSSREGEEMYVVIVGAELKHRARTQFHLILRLSYRVSLRYEAGTFEPYFHSIVRREFQNIYPSSVTEVLIREILHDPGSAGYQRIATEFDTLFCTFCSSLAEDSGTLVARCQREQHQR